MSDNDSKWPCRPSWPPTSLSATPVGTALDGARADFKESDLVAAMWNRGHIDAPGAATVAAATVAARLRQVAVQFVLSMRRQAPTISLPQYYRSASVRDLRFSHDYTKRCFNDGAM